LSVKLQIPALSTTSYISNKARYLLSWLIRVQDVLYYYYLLLTFIKRTILQ
jgi:hypothetical protein